MFRCRRLSTISAVAWMLWPSMAIAAGELGPRDSPITTSDYAVDLFQGPVLSSARVTGLSGAYAAIAEGVDGYAVNAAAPAVRMPWSVDWFDYDLSAGVTFPSGLAQTDFDNNGQVGFSYENFIFLTAGANAQLGSWGFGASLDFQSYRLGKESQVPGAPPNLSVTLARGHVLVAKAFFDHQLMLGVGTRVASLALEASENVDGSGDATKLFNTEGGGGELGLLWAPHSLPLRAGLSARTKVISSVDPSSKTPPNADGDIIVGTRYLPTSVVLPWELEAGVALQLGKRPLNPRWLDPDQYTEPQEEKIKRARAARKPTNAAKERELRRREDARLEQYEQQVRAHLIARHRSTPRQKLLITGSCLVSGPVDNAVGVDSFLRQTVERSGKRLTVTPRVGLEVEPIEQRLQVRAGSYLEPTRFERSNPRVHVTSGLDVKLVQWSVFGLFDDDTAWRGGGFIDGARDYLAWGVSVGVWH